MQGRRTHVRVAFAMQADAPAARAAGAAPDGRPPLAIRARATKMPVLRCAQDGASRAGGRTHVRIASGRLALQNSQG
jgi:hypothetical protein